MSGKLIVRGDDAPHRHDLPPIPVERREVPEVGPLNQDGTQYRGTRVETWQQVNAVARCSGCGLLFVSREDPDGWGRVVYWARLRWWHRKAWAKLRVEEARRIGGVAP